MFSRLRHAAITGAPSVISGIQYRFRYRSSRSTNDSAVIAALIASVNTPTRSTLFPSRLAAFNARPIRIAAAAGSSSAPTLASPWTESSTLPSLYPISRASPPSACCIISGISAEVKADSRTPPYLAAS